MTHRKTLLALSLVLSAAACGDGGGGTVEPTPNAELGMTLRRAVNSAVPSIADSALIRVWHPTAGINQIKAAPIPTPGSETRVSFSLPAQNGYSVGIIAFKRNGPYTLALAGGRTDAVNVVAGQANEAAVSVLPWTMAISGPDTLQSGQQATFTFSLAGGAHNGILDFAVIASSLTKWTTDVGAPSGNAATKTATGQYSATLTTPTVNGDTAFFMQPRLYLAEGWNQAERLVQAHVPSLTLGGTLFRRPIKVPGSTLTVVFDKSQRQ